MITTHIIRITAMQEGTTVKRKMLVWAIMFIFMLCFQFTQAVAEDIEGSHDHPMLKRYEGAEIVKYSFREYDSYVIPLGMAPYSGKLSDSRKVEGAVTRLTYKTPMGRSPLEVMRNYQNELQESNFTIIFTGNRTELGTYFSEAAGYKDIVWPPNVPGLTMNPDSQVFLAAENTNGVNSVMIVLYGVENSFWAGDLKDIEKGQTIFQVDVIEMKSMEQKMVTVAAEEMAEKITSSGRVALYGIYFDTDKAEIKVESSATIEQIAKLLQDNEQLKLLVVGHTDNSGGFDHNMALSRRRAVAVVRELTVLHGISGDRLRPVGVAYASPVASNSIEDGRAKNRRVELVETLN
jgi:outer membrane protein OmpA-like peptidoglycan-associated protein